MKIEGETIVIRVGGGFLTIQEFVAMNCGTREDDEQQKKRITNLVYAGKCAGNKEFKTFYMSQHTLDGDTENNPEDQSDDFVVERQRKNSTGNKHSRGMSKNLPTTPKNMVIPTTPLQDNSTSPFSQNMNCQRFSPAK